MLEYEKRLHFDKRYQKLQNQSWIKDLACICWCIACYLGIYYGLFVIRGVIPDMFAWNHSRYIVDLMHLRITVSDVAYFSIGLVMMCYGAVRLTRISRENHKVRENGCEQPDHLIVEGYYAQVRHPMYGTFVILYGAIAFSIHSLISMVVIIIFGIGQYLNAYIEEKRKLLPLFGDEYEQYKVKVRGWIFTRWQIVFLSVFLIITVIGFLPL